MAIDLITGHQGVSHISADQIATINNAMMDNFGANKVMRLVGGELTADGLTITISEGYWRVNGFDMEIQEGETLYIDPTTIGLSRIDDIYVEILQDIPTGAQRAEIYIALGEPSATPTAPDEPTAPYLNTDILLQVVPLASVTVTEGAMIMTDLTIAYEMVTPSELEAVETIATDAQTAARNARTTANTANTNATNALNMIRSTSSDAYSSSKAYSVGDHVIYNNKVYKCITACSAGSWSVNKKCFETTTLTKAVTELNSDLSEMSVTWNSYITDIRVSNVQKCGKLGLISATLITNAIATGRHIIGNIPNAIAGNMTIFADETPYRGYIAPNSDVYIVNSSSTSIGGNSQLAMHGIIKFE